MPMLGMEAYHNEWGNYVVGGGDEFLILASMGIP